MPKHYIQNAAADYTPTSFKGAWDDTAVAVTRAIGLYAAPTEEQYPPNVSTTLPLIARAETNVSGSWDVCLLRLVSAPLAANITIDDAITLTLMRYESSTNANFFTHIHAWVTQGDTSNVRGTLVTDDISGTEWLTLAAAQFVTEAPAITSVAAQAGDRIVIEFGYRATNTVTTSYTGTVYYGSKDVHLDADPGIDPATGPMYNPIVVITDAVEYSSQTRLTTLQAEVAVQAVDNLATTRVTQLVVEEAVTQLATTRFTQVVVEVLVLPPSADIVFPDVACIEPARYFIKLFDSNGTLTGIIDEPKTFRIEHYLNG